MSGARKASALKAFEELGYYGWSKDSFDLNRLIGSRRPYRTKSNGEERH